MSVDDIFLNAAEAAAECTRIGIPTSRRAALRMMALPDFPLRVVRGVNYVQKSELRTWLTSRSAKPNRRTRKAA